mmetsp:Transcript_41658/g.114969  ORF Transcript_41658/g.114969 Transcript_41658/m.114969 type:complete len:214 (+) Transcript_41658:1453-2094(+)
MADDSLDALRPPPTGPFGAVPPPPDELCLRKAGGAMLSGAAPPASLELRLRPRATGTPSACVAPLAREAQGLGVTARPFAFAVPRRPLLARGAAPRGPDVFDVGAKRAAFVGLGPRGLGGGGAGGACTEPSGVELESLNPRGGASGREKLPFLPMRLGPAPPGRTTGLAPRAEDSAGMPIRLRRWPKRQSSASRRASLAPGRSRRWPDRGCLG